MEHVLLRGLGVSTVLWFIGFGLMMASFTFLFGRPEERHQPRITVDTRLRGSNPPK